MDELTIYLLKALVEKRQKEKMLEKIQGAGLFGNMTGGGAGESYRTGLDIQRSAPVYLKGFSDEMLPEYAVRTPEEQRALSFQNRLGAYMTAKNIQKPDVSMVRAPKDIIRRSLLARNVEKALAPEFAGRNFIQGSKGEFKERDQIPNVFMNVPAGYEVSGYDSKGNPRITKIKTPHLDRKALKIENNIALLKQKGAPLEDIEAYIKSEGYLPKEFSNTLSGYTKKKKKGFLGMFK